MKLMVILIGLAVEQFLGHLEELRDPKWWLVRLGRWRDWVAVRWDGPVGVVFVLSIPVGTVGLLQAALEGVLLGLLSLAFAVVVLLYCLGPRQLGGDVDVYLEASASGDAERVERAVHRLTGVETEEPPPLSSIIDAILAQPLQRWFGVLFWFVLLGPMGAVLYRLSWALCLPSLSDHRNVGFDAAAARLYELLTWLPARLLALAYALAGSFDDTWHAWRDTTPKANAGCDADLERVTAAGRGALRIDEVGRTEPAADGDTAGTVNSAMGLIWRSLLLWLTVIALFTLAGWAG